MVSGPPSYVWEVAGKPISIQLSFDVIDRMSPDMLRGLGALKRRGAEVGGILLGRLEGNPPTRVIVEDFEPVASEYLTGPSYNLSEKDLVAFETAMERRKADAADKLSVVGFYRSHTRDELYMDDADLALARRYFAQPGNVFLIVKPFATRPCVGGFFFWEDGEIARGSTYRQFPFDRRELGGGEPRPEPEPRAPPRTVSPMREAPVREAPLPPYTPAVEREPAAEEPWQASPRTSSLSILAGPETAAPPSRKLQWRWLLVPGFLAIGAVAGFVGYRNLGNNRPFPSVEPALPLRLSVFEQSNQLDVTWDRNAPAVTGAKRGVLSISDGSKKRDLELSGAQLRNGRVLYSRLSGDVNLRLEVFPEGQPSVTESIRVVSTEGQAASKPPDSSAQHAAPTNTAPRAPRIPAARVLSTPPVDTTPAPEPEIELPRPARRR
jgi:hypothetical protein